MKTIDAKTLQQKLKENRPNFKLINALEPSRFILKHIPGSINLPGREAIEQTLHKNDEIVVYCTNYCCNASIVLYEVLNSMGYTNIHRFAGGLQEWSMMGLPLEGTLVKVNFS